MNKRVLIHSAKLGDKIYPINTDWRVGIECERVMYDKSYTDEERASIVTGLLFGEDAPFTQEAVDKAVIYLDNTLGERKKVGHEEKIIDFDQHFDLFHSAFKAQYGRNLYTDDFHFHEFKSELAGMKDQALTDVIELLTYDMSTVKDAKQRAKILKAQDNFRYIPPKTDFKDEMTSEKQMIYDILLGKGE